MGVPPSGTQSQDANSKLAAGQTRSRSNVMAGRDTSEPMEVETSDNPDLGLQPMEIELPDPEVWR